MVEQLRRARDYERRRSDQDRGPSGTIAEAYRIYFRNSPNAGSVTFRVGFVLPDYDLITIPWNAVADVDAPGENETNIALSAKHRFEGGSLFPSNANVTVEGGRLPYHSLKVKFGGSVSIPLAIFQIDSDNLSNGSARCWCDVETETTD